MQEPDGNEAADRLVHEMLGELAKLLSQIVGYIETPSGLADPQQFHDQVVARIKLVYKEMTVASDVGVEAAVGSTRLGPAHTIVLASTAAMIELAHERLQEKLNGPA